MRRFLIILMTGTVSAQVVNILSSLILTRLYEPSDFGFFSLYVALSTQISSIASLKYEQAIMIPKFRRSGLDVSSVALICIFFVTLLLFIFCFYCFYIYPIDYFLQINEAILILPISVFLVALNQVYNIWNLRNVNYLWQAKIRIVQSFSRAIFSVFLAFILNSFWGLIIGSLFSHLLVSILHQYKKNNLLKMAFHFYDKKRLKQAFERFDNFPKIMLPAKIIESFTTYLPTFIILPVFGAEAAGYFFLANTVVRLPVTFVSSAVAEVVRERMSKAINNRKLLKKIYIKVFLNLTMFSFLGFSILAFLAPMVFRLVYGKEWELAGSFTQILSIMYFFQFISGPLSTVFILKEKQKQDFIIQVVIFSLLAFFVYYMMSTSSPKIEFFLLMYSMIYSIKYITQLIMSFKYVLTN